MYRIALVLLSFALQGPQSVGVVTGVVRGANGMPAAGIRVYAIGVQEGVEVNASAPLEGLTQTDASGRYRMEVAPGRYYIATGSVSSPTFYPGTTSTAAARVLTVASGGLIEAIDFSSFVVPPAASQRGFFVVSGPSGTGVLSGNLRFADGTPAGGIPVAVVSASSSQATLAGATSFAAGLPTGINFTRSVTSDSNGRYVLQNLPADKYYVAAGFAESPKFYPGVDNILIATPIPTTATTNLGNLDFTVLRPPAGVRISGHVVGVGEVPAPGAMVSINSTTPTQTVFGLPTSRPRRTAVVGNDGRFEILNLPAGAYTVQAASADFRTESVSLSVGIEPIADVNLSIRAAGISGRIVGEDGNVIPDALLFGEAILSTTSNPNLVFSTLLPIARDGTFGRLLTAEEYRFFLRLLPEEYSIESIRAGSVDLMKETLKFTGIAPVNVEVRVAKRTPSASRTGVSVDGRILDAITAMPSAAIRITLCCRDGVTQRFSAPLKPDGSFAFDAIPPGQYSVGLQTREGSPGLFTVERDLVVKDQNISGLDLSSTSGFGEISANLVVENGTPFVAAPGGMSVVFTGSNGRVRVTATRLPIGGGYHASLPAGDRYSVSVLNPPEGFVLKSVLGSTEVRPPNNPSIGAPTPLVPIVITLGPGPR